LLANIRTCAYYTVGTSTTKNILATTSISYAQQATVANENYGTITITPNNISTICLHADAYSATKNTSYSYTNWAKVKITSIQNVGGANYSLGANNVLVSDNSSDGSTTYTAPTRDLLPV